MENKILKTKKSIIFDCDGVLVNSERLAHEIKINCLRTLGISLSLEEAFEMFMGKSLENGFLLLERMIGKPLPYSWIYNYAMEMAHVFAKELKEIEGVRQVLEECIKDGRKLCVASQSELPRVRFSLHVTKLDQFFKNNICTASMVKHPKPAPDIFLYAAEIIGTKPENCIVIEDSPTGAAGARTAGMRVFGYAAAQNVEKLEKAGAKVFTNMLELTELIRNED